MQQLVSSEEIWQQRVQSKNLFILSLSCLCYLTSTLERNGQILSTVTL